MKAKARNKKILDNWLIALIIVLGAVSAINNWLIYASSEHLTITGFVSKTADVELCFNNAPNINLTCAATATANTAYSCDLNETESDGNSLTFSDNSSLFDIASSTGVISFTPSSSAVGIHVINISSTDNSGCSNRFGSSIFELTISQASSSGDGSSGGGSGGGSSGGSGSGGGGGGGGGSGGGAAAAVGAGAIPQESIQEEKTQVWGEVKENSYVSMSINKEDIAITKVGLYVNADVRGLEINIKSLKHDTTGKIASDKAYQHLQINKANIIDTQIEGVRIEFKVPKSWLVKNRLKDRDIAMFRYKDDNWGELPTKVTGSDSAYAYYETISNGFSFFAIGSRQLSENVAGSAKDASIPFSVSTDIIKVAIVQNSTTTHIFTIKNLDDKTLGAKLNVKGISEYVGLSDNSIILGPKEEKAITLGITAPDRTEAYHGRILIEAGSKIKEIALVIEVKSRISMLDIAVNVPKNYIKEEKGQDVTGIISLLYFGEEKPINVSLFYAVRNLDGKAISFNEEKLEINNGLLVTRMLEIPENIHSGKYIFYAKASYSGNAAIGSDSFDLSENALTDAERKMLLMVVLITMLVILAAVTIFNISRLKESAEIPLDKEMGGINDDGYLIGLMEKAIESLKEGFKKESTQEKEYEKIKSQVSKLGNLKKESKIDAEKIKKIFSALNRIFNIHKKEENPASAPKKKFSKEELNKMLDILKADLQEGIIKEESYYKQKKKIESLIKEKEESKKAENQKNP